MSVKVDLDRLDDALADFTFAYLITVGDDSRAHTVSVGPTLADGVLVVGDVGRRTAANAISHTDVTLLWPPADAAGYTLIVDGRAVLTDRGLTIVPSSAVLHRAAIADSPNVSDCGGDCLPLKTD